ncbi:hypothetical protein [Desulfosporosinus sp. Sb-LF]|uniref:hypothetical protein n=1 Tax=Desulfosporosinus sp. Sb-LF TaxID=2560027 RepID=UPI00107F9A37|nr:hypothetical protein [Desulfosporosinus sp. Sb-LF]TGE33342.1 hypothetical protein E4K68_07560 [Desulfosporosinus sp. Sb-LF]
MIKVEEIEVMNFEGALRGMRNPLESWGQSDSKYISGEFVLGEKDLEVALKLVKAGSDHSKFMRQIFVSMDITAPMSWWWDFDTYKVATTKNSTSRMHKLGTRTLDFRDFSVDDEDGEINITPLRKYVLEDINRRIKEYQQLKKTDVKDARKLWRDIILDLPQNYNFLSTWTGSFENLRNVYHAREHHKQREFREFCKILESLPYSELIVAKQGVI